MIAIRFFRLNLFAAMALLSFAAMAVQADAGILRTAQIEPRHCGFRHAGQPHDFGRSELLCSGTAAGSSLLPDALHQLPPRWPAGCVLRLPGPGARADGVVCEESLHLCLL